MDFLPRPFFVNADRPVTTTLLFCAVDIPENWNGRRTVQVNDDAGNEAMMTVAPQCAKALRRAALLAKHDLCERIDIGVDISGLHVVEVYWEG